jgi:tRNA1Val (adenine37-N6)-methyltransferase
MREEVFTRDRFLGGRVLADQPKSGFRAGHDTVLLAAAVSAQPGERVVELGSGVGIASLCLAARVPGISILGVEIDESLVPVANANAVLNQVADRVRFEAGDAGTLDLGRTFAHVFFNPPFHPETGRGSPDLSRERAKRGGDDLIARWTDVALAHASATVTAILRADRIEEMLALAHGRIVHVLPLLPRTGEAPKRAIIRIERSKSGEHRVLEGFVQHEADGRNTEAAEAVLRHGAALTLA